MPGGLAQRLQGHRRYFWRRGRDFRRSQARAPSDRLGAGKTVSGFPPIVRGDDVVQLQIAELFARPIPRAHARALLCALRVPHRASQSRSDHRAEVEMTVTIGVRAWKSKESLRRRVQHMRLRYRRGGACATEGQVETQLSDFGECGAQRLSGSTVAAPTLTPLQARSLGAQRREPHWPLAVPGSCGVEPARSSAGSPLAPASFVRAARRCCFSCCLALRASSRCRLA